jgi:hypothetical protein
MATLDWSQCPGVERIPGKLGGAWVFRNSRMPVKLDFAARSLDTVSSQRRPTCLFFSTTMFVPRGLARVLAAHSR